MARRHVVIAFVLASVAYASSAGAPQKYVNAYPGGERPQREVAVLLPSPHYALIARVDGKKIRKPWLGQSSVEVRVLPGTHEIVVECHQGVKLLARPSFTARFEAGHFYVVLCHNLENGYGKAGMNDLGTQDPRWPD